MRKQRTRSHIIADLSVNHVERYALLCGYTVERVVHDYGVDLILHTYDANGEPESESVYIQVKATDNLPILEDQQTISLSVERADLERWLAEVMPTILILYDAQSNVAYWTYIQAYFARQPDFHLTQVRETITVHLQRANVIDEAAVRMFARFKENILRQIQGVVHYDE